MLCMTLFTKPSTEFKDETNYQRARKHLNTCSFYIPATSKVCSSVSALWETLASCRQAPSQLSWDVASQQQLHLSSPATLPSRWHLYLSSLATSPSHSSGCAPPSRSWGRAPPLSQATLKKGKCKIPFLRISSQAALPVIHATAKYIRNNIQNKQHS